VSGFAAARAGATAIEYALIAGLVSILIVTAVTMVGTSVQALFQRLADHM
jgi:pilus assembly protein Flp/PilA